MLPGWAQYTDETWRAQWVAAMFHHFLRTQTKASGSGSGSGSSSSGGSGSSSSGSGGSSSDGLTAAESSAAGTGRGAGARAGSALVLTASLRQSFDATAFLWSAFAQLPTSTTTSVTAAAGTGTGEREQGSAGGGGDLPTPLWHQESHCPNDRILLRKLMLGRIAECLRDDLSMCLTGSLYQAAIQPSMVPTHIPDPTTGGVQVISPLVTPLDIPASCPSRYTR